jgi:hyaluronan synthase
MLNLLQELGSFGWYGAAVCSLLMLKMLMSLRTVGSVNKPRRAYVPELSVAAVITVYNEAPDMIRRCLTSLLEQTRLPDAVVVVDDCSATDAARLVVQELKPAFDKAGVRMDLIRFTSNLGKRHGLAAGFRLHPTAGLYLCVDSDTILHRKALAEAIIPFGHDLVHAVTGLVMANNRAKNLLTRLIDMRYVNAFLGERVAYGRLGSVLCVCGSLAVYRGWVVRKYLDDFLNQRFMGKPATSGDDRRLTYYCLREGETLIVPTAVARTDVPENLSHYIRQQIRWGKSFIREGGLLARQTQYAGRAFYWLNILELGTWLLFTGALVAAVASVALHPAGPIILVGYVTYAFCMAWLRSIHYLRRAPGVPFLDRLLTYLAAPLYALMNITLLLPLRLYSLATLQRNGWGTRASVEIGELDPVRAGDSPEWRLYIDQLASVEDS